MGTLRIATLVALAVVFTIIAPLLLVTGFTFYQSDFIVQNNEINQRFSENSIFDTNIDYPSGGYNLVSVIANIRVTEDTNGSLWLVDNSGERYLVFSYPERVSPLTGKMIVSQDVSRGRVSITEISRISELPLDELLDEEEIEEVGYVMYSKVCQDTCLFSPNAGKNLHFELELDSGVLEVLSFTYSFGKNVETISFGVSVLDSNQTNIDNELVIRTKEGDMVSTIHNKRTNGLLYTTELAPGDYDLEIIPYNSNVSILFRDVPISTSSEPKVTFESFGNEELNALIFSSDLEFSEGEISLMSKGEEFYSCESWNLQNSECDSAWEYGGKIENEIYSISLSKKPIAVLEHKTGLNISENQTKIPKLLNIEFVSFTREREISVLNTTVYRGGVGIISSGEENKRLTPGVYDVVVSLQKENFKNMSIKNALLTEENNSFGFEEFEMDGTVQAFAIDPTTLNFTEAKLYVEAKGNEVYKCKDWNFTLGECGGDWVKLLDVTPGEIYELTITPDDPAFVEVSISSCGSHSNVATASRTFATACTSSNLQRNDGTTVSLTYGRAAGGVARYGGVRVNSTNTSVTNCNKVTRVEICYEWWRSSTEGTQEAYISVDANNLDSLSSVTTTLPGTTANPGVTCTDITSLESWTCSNFFGTGATGAIIQSEINSGGSGAAQSFITTWDVLMFNVTYQPSNDFGLSLISPGNDSKDSNGIVNFKYKIEGDTTDLETCSLLINENVYRENISTDEGTNVVKESGLFGVITWGISCKLKTNEYINTSNRVLSILAKGGSEVFLPTGLLKDSRNDELPVVIKFKDVYSLETDEEWNQTEDELQQNFVIPEGYYDLLIEKVTENKIKSIYVHNATITNDTDILFKIEDDIRTNNIIGTFAINPQINYTYANITSIAHSDRLLKCKDWNWEEQTCDGDWTFLMDITPGEEYTFTITPDDPGFAESGAIYCYTSPCIAPESLIMSKDNIATPEPNYPNTIDGCADGTSGTYKGTAETVEKINLTNLNSTYFQVGHSVTARATVFCFDGTTRVNFVYANNTSSANWRVLATGACPSSNALVTFIYTFVLDNIDGNHSFRAITGYNLPTTSTCFVNAWADHDDVSFVVYSSNRYVTTNKPSYTSIAEFVNIYGANWNNNSNVTMNLTKASSGMNVFYGNVSTNSNGVFSKDVPVIDFEYGDGTYSIFVHEYNTPTQNASTSIEINTNRYLFVEPSPTQEVYQGFNVTYSVPYDNDTVITKKLDKNTQDTTTATLSSTTEYYANQFTYTDWDYYDTNVNVCIRGGYDSNNDGNTNPLLNVTLNDTVTTYQIVFTTLSTSPQWQCVNVPKSYFGNNTYIVGFKCQNCRLGNPPKSRITFRISIDNTATDSWLWNGATWAKQATTYYIRTNHTLLGTGTEVNVLLPNGTTQSLASVLKTQKVEDVLIEYNNTLLGNYTFYSLWKGIYINRTVGSVDTTPPDITVISPINQTYFNNSVWFNITATDNYQIDTCQFSLNGSANVTMSNDTSTNYYYLNSSMSYDQYNITFYCNDTSGNSNQTNTIFFTVSEIPTTLLFSTDKEVYQQSYEDGSNDIFILLEARYLDNDSNPIPDALCQVDNDKREGLRNPSINLTYNISTGNYTGSMNTVELYNTILFNVTCSKLGYKTAENTTSTKVWLFMYLWNTTNLSFGDGLYQTTYLIREEPIGPLAILTLNQSLGIGLNLIRDFDYCGAGINCSLGRDYFYEDLALPVSINISINDSSCKPYVCSYNRDENFNKLYEHCPSSYDGISVNTPTLVESNISHSHLLEEGTWTGISLYMNCSSSVEQTTNIYYNYSGQPPNFIITSPKVLYINTLFVGDAQLDSDYYIGPNQRVNCTRKAWINFNNTFSEDISMDYYFPARIKLQYSDSILPNTTYVYNSTDELWASDNVSVMAPYLAEILSGNRIFWTTEIIPNNTNLNETVQSDLLECVRNDEELTFSNTTMKVWGIDAYTIFLEILSAENVTIWSNYSTYGVGDDWVFIIKKTVGNTITDISDEVTFYSTNSTIVFPETDIYGPVYYEITAINDTEPPEIQFVPPTPDNESVINVDYIFINVSISDLTGVDECWINFNGTNQPMIKESLGTNFICYINKTTLSPNNYTFTVYANDTKSLVGYSDLRTVRVNDKPTVEIVLPKGEIYGQNRHVGILIDTFDQDGINSSMAQIKLPDGWIQNVTMYNISMSDNFDSDSVGQAWHTEETIGPSQTCVLDINTTVLGKAYTSISGEGSPRTGSLCSLVSKHPVVGDFDLFVSFDVISESGSDYALNVQLTEVPYSANSSRMMFMSLSNWFGYERVYEVFVDDGNFSAYISERETNDTEGKFRIKREGSNFTFYTWNNSNSDWNEESVSYNTFDFYPSLFITLEVESGYPEWGEVNVTWDDLDSGLEPRFVGLFSNTSLLGTYNVTLFVTDNFGGINDTEKTNFTVEYVNDRPSTPFVFSPYSGEHLRGEHLIVWSEVIDDNSDNLQFNISLLNETLDYNATVVSNYGNTQTVSYLWNTTQFPDGNYSLSVMVFENETVDQNTNEYIVYDIVIDNTFPTIDFIPPTPPSGDFVSVDYFVVNITSVEENVYKQVIRLYDYLDILDFEYTSYGTLQTSYNFSYYGEGFYYFDALVVDIAGNENITEKRNVTIDLTYPTIEIISPENTTYYNDTQLVNISSYDLHPDQVWFSWNGTNQTYKVPINTTFSAGEITLHAWANDTAGHLNYTNVSFTIVLNKAPSVINVTYLSVYDPLEGQNKKVELAFAVYDEDGTGDLNDSSAKLVINKSVVSYTNQSCTYQVLNSTTKEYTCSVYLRYYDSWGDWDINVSINDSYGELAYNDTESFYYSKLASITLINETIHFGTKQIGTPNATNLNNPLVINNTGNLALNVNITGADIGGVTNSSYSIGVGNVTFNDDDNSTGDGLGNLLTQLSTTPTNYNPNATLLNTKSYMNIYWWIQIPTGLIAQAYEAVWSIDVYE